MSGFNHRVSLRHIYHRQPELEHRKRWGFERLGFSGGSQRDCVPRTLSNPSAASIVAEALNATFA